MIPSLFTDVPGAPLQVMMNGSVGRGGRNELSDARLIQALLSRAPAAMGGPLAPLVVDGRVGPKTIEAISRFQRRHLGFADGLVEPNRRTVRTLVPLIRSNGGVQNIRGIGPADPRVAMAVNAQQNAPDLVFGSTFMANSGWEFTGSAGISLGVKWGGVTTGIMTIRHVSQPTVIYKLHFGGLALGVSSSELPFSFSASLPSFPGFGTSIRLGLWARPPLRVNDFRGPCTVFTLDGNVTAGPSGGAAGWSGAIVTFGPGGFWIAAGALTGAQVALSKGVGASMCVGMVADWS
jgi:peptidoglycan hydrolase-like protein with peptidoglycan-binding domain